MKDITEEIIHLKNKFEKNIQNFSNVNFSYIKKIYVKQYLKNFLNELKNTNNISRKKIIGKEIHQFEKYLKDSFLLYKKKNDSSKDSCTFFDVDESILKTQLKYGTAHPLQKFKELIEDVCSKMGFSIVEGPDIEMEDYNFTKLNIPKYHPARDMQDTFYIDKKKRLLRSHTSSVQIRALEENKPPLQCISCGSVYRVDDVDAQHTPMFYQIEGIFVDKNINFANLKGIILLILQEIFDKTLKVRFRPSYYPYTEPSAAVDIGCIICDQKGCNTCKSSGWITVLGSGMIHRNVFKSINYDYNKWKGFAFGMGINRLAMIYYNLPSLSCFYENNVSLWKNIK